VRCADAPLTKPRSWAKTGSSPPVDERHSLDEPRVAMIYQHEERGAGKAITDAIDAHLTDEQFGDDDGDDGASGVPSNGS
jgi:hypothetical protein